MQDQLLLGIALGGVYALIALGYTMVYGIIELINFAHGEIMMFGVFFMYAFAAVMPAETALAIGIFASFSAYFAFEGPLMSRTSHVKGRLLALLVAAVVGHMVKVLSLAETPLLIAIPSGVICAGILGAALERICYRPLRDAPRLAPLITAIGASLFFQNLAQLIFGTHRHSFPLPTEVIERRVAGVSIAQVLIIVIAFATMAALHLFITRTRTGTAMRATAQDRRAAALMGINVNFIIALTFVIGSMLAAVGGFLLTVHQKSLGPYMGFMAGIKAFTAAVLGGIGNIPGAMIGGFLLGIIESLGASALPNAGYKDAIAFIILIAVLLFKPTGILGKPVVIKV